ncbi:HK97-gp10 family putative phage morphogenesis protein [Schleiferilactobacillus harbinensis]|uniref:HK97-gp10 family putative phage morphogenesis protein n=1 Tax=Schleiferilactobacillus harbinensis TaxID=304207 RepID=UPI0039E9588C
MAEGENGFEEVAKLMGKYADVGQVGHEGLMRGAKILEAKLKQNAPYDPTTHSKYGHLRDQIQVETEGEDVQVTAGDAFWWRFVEHGTGGAHPQPAQNFARGTLEQNLETITKEMTKGLND